MLQACSSIFFYFEGETNKFGEMKYLIVGLGNIGAEYEHTRHNIGFDIVSVMADELGAKFETKRYGDVTKVRVKNAELILLKPSTYMNLSGDAVRYWMNEEKIPIDRVLILVDDLALPFGTLRLKGKGSDAGHNGLKHIAQQLQSQNYPRLRFGLGNDYPQGQQIDFVLGRFSSVENAELGAIILRAIEMIKSFALQGLQRTMNQFN